MSSIARWRPHVRKLNNAGWRHDHHRGGRPVRDFAGSETVKGRIPATGMKNFACRALAWTLRRFWVMRADHECVNIWWG